MCQIFDDIPKGTEDICCTNTNKNEKLSDNALFFMQGIGRTCTYTWLTLQSEERIQGDYHAV